jgi:hypothetical protein
MQSCTSGALLYGTLLCADGWPGYSEGEQMRNGVRRRKSTEGGTLKSVASACVIV